ncbi:MAG TPA: ABC transporter ATP-binding protein [Thermodesulfobacteriota bacterium]
MTRESRVRLEGVTKTYPAASAPAVADLSLDVAPGEILALLGPSGCGKTTTLRLVAGFETPETGRIVVGGRVVDDDRVHLPPEQRGIGFVFQDYALFPHLTVRDNIAFGLRRMPEAERAARVRTVIELCELGGMEGRFPHELSGGQQQRTALARAMAPGAEVVLLDEPLASLDPEIRATLRGEIRRTLKQAGKTAILVTHDQDEAFEIADRVGVLDHGRLQQIGTPEEIFYAPATRFVALFVGQANFVPGLVDGESIDTEVGRLANEPGLAPGTPVDVMLRPSNVQLEADPDGPGIVTARVFHGSERVYTVRLPSGLELRASLPSTSALAEGARVAVIARPTHVVAFGRGQA